MYIQAWEIIRKAGKQEKYVAGGKADWGKKRGKNKLPKKFNFYCTTNDENLVFACQLFFSEHVNNQC